MADSTENRGGQDRARINIHQEHELRYWTHKFGVTREQLEDAVKRVGVSAHAVAEALGKKA